MRRIANSATHHAAAAVSVHVTDLRHFVVYAVFIFHARVVGLPIQEPALNPVWFTKYGKLAQQIL